MHSKSANTQLTGLFVNVILCFLKTTLNIGRGGRILHFKHVEVVVTCMNYGTSPHCQETVNTDRAEGLKRNINILFPEAISACQLAFFALSVLCLEDILL